MSGCKSSSSSSSPDKDALSRVPGAGLTRGMNLLTIPRDWQALIISYLDWHSHFALSRVNRNLQAACRVHMSWGGRRRIVAVGAAPTSLSELMRVCDALQSDVFGLRTVPVALNLADVVANVVTDEWCQTVSSTLPSTLYRLNLSSCGRVTDVGVGYVSTLTQRLESLSLQLCVQVTDVGVASLCKLARLQSLDLSGCSSVTHAGFMNLQLLSQLRSLCLRGCSQVNDNVLSAVSELTQLQTLDVNGCRLITDAGMVHMSKLTQLQTLDFSRCVNVSDTGFSQISTLTKLRSLSPCACITDVGIERLSTFTHLQELTVKIPLVFHVGGVASVLSLPQLQSLQIWGAPSSITADALLALWTTAPSPHLRTLDVSHQDSFVNDAFVARLALCTQLRTLNLKGCHLITDAGVAHVATLTQLQELNISLCDAITDIGVAHLSTLTQLRTLSLTNCNRVTDSGFAPLTKLSRLQSLSLQSLPITDAGLAYLRPSIDDANADDAGTTLLHLRALHLSHCCSITDDGIATVVAIMPHLQELHMSMCKRITDTGVAHLSKLQQLHSLHLFNCKHVTDASVAKLFESSSSRVWQRLNLSGCDQITDASLACVSAACSPPPPTASTSSSSSSSISELMLWGCQRVTKEAIDRLRASLPRTRVSQQFEPVWNSL